MLERDQGKILDKTPPERAFYSYSGIGLFSARSDNLADCCDKIRSVDIKSIEFHIARGDFESWIRLLGDAVLDKKLRLIRKLELTGEVLRKRLQVALSARCPTLRLAPIEFLGGTE